MQDQFSRTAMLLGNAQMDKIYSSRVAVFGIGGVGGYCAEALARTGVGTLDLYDNDTVNVTNINRQIIATHKTIGRYKVDVMRERILEINPNAAVFAHRMFFLPETADSAELSGCDYIVDAVDTITAKLELIRLAYKLNIPIVSSMGAANKLDASAFEVADIYDTTVCPVARVMRRELRKIGIPSLKVVYSREPAIKPETEPDGGSRRQIPASTAFVPPVAGFILAGEVVRDLAGILH